MRRLADWRHVPAVFSPSSIAVVGASADLDRISGRPVRYLERHGYEGDVYPVNPNHDEVGGLPAFPSVSDLPETPDLAMVIVPADVVPEVVEECYETGVDAVLVVSSGFAETGDDAAVAAERGLANLADAHDATLIGPNSQGIINVRERVAASFTPALEREPLRSGGVSFVSQSGAFGGALTTMLQDEYVGLNKWVATGNEAQVESLDFLRTFAADETTEVVAGYVEGFDDGRTLLEVKRTEAGIDLPVVLLKVGRSERGKTAAVSHTGKIAGSQRVYDGVFAEMGVVAVDDVHRFVDVTRTVSTLDRLPGRRLGVVTTSGGAGVHIADVAADEGLELPALTGSTRERIESHIPAYGSAVNPVDITAQVVNSRDAFRECLEALLEDDGIDTVLLQSTNASGDRALGYAEMVAEVAAESDTPLVVSWTGGVEKAAARERYRDAGIPVFENPAAAVETIAALTRFRASKARLRAARDLPARAPAQTDDGPAVMTETSAKELLSEYDVAVPAERLVDDATAAAQAAEDVGYPVVAKLVSPDVEHRARIGAVRTDLATASAVESAFEEIAAVAEAHDATLEGVSIQEQVAAGTELGLGITIDDDFGPVVMLGRGGVDVEAVGDVTVRTIPTAPAQAAAMLDDLETVDATTFSADDRSAIAAAVVALSSCYCDNPWIREADVNPVVVGPDGVVAVDALFLGPS